MFRLSVAVALALIGASTSNPADAAQRAFVSSSGNDTNTASGCGLAAPCRSFSSAQTVVSDGGEIVALDAAGYGPITVTKNVTITANPGFYAGIAAPSGDAVTIATAGIKVTLRGLNISSIGASNGVNMTNGAQLSIENCVISNFLSGYGVSVDTPASVRIIDSLIRDGGSGVNFQGGATGVISGSKIVGNSNTGVIVYGDMAGTTAAAITDTVISGSLQGILAFAGNAGAVARASVIRSTLSNIAYAITVNGSAGTTVVTLSDSMVTENGTAFFQVGVGTTLESLGNNTVRQNGTDTVGTLTTVSPM